MKMTLWMTGVLLLGLINAHAQLHTEAITYKQGDTTLNGYLAYDSGASGQRPGVLVVHEWWGLNDYARSRADQLARLGYVALAVDMYGNGATAETPQEAGALMTPLKNNRPLMRERIAAALATLKAQPQVDPGHMAAIGYCFGGTTVLELARSGADLAGVVSFHGGLDTPTPADAKNIRCKVLALHGAEDPYAPAAQIQAFQEEMRSAGVDWQLVLYGDAVHGFTNPKNGTDKSKGVAYNEKADHRSWEAMKQFFAEIFK